MFRESHGRIINNVSDFYVRPTDDDEHTRGEVQHALLRERLGGLFIRPDLVKAALAPKPGLQPSIIDLGTGSGTWACEMGRMFPEAKVIGLDLVPARFSQNPPPNCQFECDDVNWGLPHYKNSFDIVHARFVCTGLENYYGLLEDAASILRPRGLFLSLEGSMQLFDESGEKILAEKPGEPSFSWVNKFLRTVVELMKAEVASGITAFYLIPTWLKVQGFWEASDVEEYTVPVGPWKANMTERETFIAESMRENLLLLLDSWRPFFLDKGMLEEEADEMIAGADDELRNLKAHTYAKFYACWAIRKEHL